MGRRLTLRDNVVGWGRSIRNGTAMNPLATMREINVAHDERVLREGRPVYDSGNDLSSRLRSWLWSLMKQLYRRMADPDGLAGDRRRH